MKSEMKVDAGEILAFSEGEYSDYGYRGHVVAIKDFDLGQMMRQHISERIEQYAEEYSPTDGFETFLVASGVVVPLTCREVHIGSYGNVDPDFGAMFEAGIFDELRNGEISKAEAFKRMEKAKQ